jgi:hypothetical protein
MAAVAAVVLGGCSHTVAPNAQVQDLIRKQLQRPESGLDSKDIQSVACGAKTPKAGTVMQCTVKVATKQAMVNAVYTSEDAYTLEPQQAIVNTEKLAASLTTGDVKSARCGDIKVVVLAKGDPLDCTITLGDGSTSKVTEKVGDGLVLAPVTAPVGPQGGSTTSTLTPTTTTPGASPTSSTTGPTPPTT